jgi:uncharacterized membrane protein
MLTVIFGILSAISWGLGDFCGGLAARFINARMVVLFSQVAGGAAMLALASAWGETALSWRDTAISAVAGIIGSTGLLLLYRIFATGEVSIAAPVTGVVSTIVPVLFGMLAQGLPTAPVLIGFALAVLGVWFVSRPANAAPLAPAKIGLPVFVGVCFGVFLILIAQLHSPAKFVPLVWARVASVSLLLVLAMSQKQYVFPSPKVWLPIAACGVFDAMGNVLFIVAKQSGRLDVAAALSSLYPASTLVLALFFFKERMSRWQTVGVLLVLVAIPLIAR